MIILETAVAGLCALGDLEVSGGFGADALVGESVWLYYIFYGFLLAAILRI